VLKWFPANIGVHHVHNLAGRIPYYRLPEVLHDFPELRDLGRLTALQSLKGLRLVPWDDRRRRLVSFKELPSIGSAASP
jgi:omega-6 fatty acid desaturase (delta-12 desaturase)